ncbi:uncharacterized protein EHS24_003129 [Apiotrichum porosum]|uniref:Uncharacterized protein n=1 Tax=Apiotrichum porosum TaxID=105984 RepID=A0A427XFA0_9TREE|nr:uncharacterized protein EHS24_003129 [Apiotrichum porosum]RSH77569.1 hypothetical protein EHS24_003129 [Apiotrichum porosum]
MCLRTQFGSRSRSRHTAERRAMLWDYIEEHFPYLENNQRLQYLRERRDLEFPELVKEVRRLITVEPKNAAPSCPPAIYDNPRMRFEGKLKSEGITDAVEVLFEDTGKLRSRIYLVLAEVDPLFEINDGEYRMLLDDRGFCLPDVLREILRILDMGAYAIPISMWHNLSGAKSDSGPV